MKSKIPEIVDCVFIGTSPISILEASYQAHLGNSVLLVDNNFRIGGSWCPLDIFGLHDVENAIHYFLEDKVAFDFMRETLGWSVVKSENKYRVFHKRVLGIHKIPYDNLIGRIISQFLYENADENSVTGITSAIRLKLKTLGRKSVYVKGGCSEIIRSVEKLVRRFNLTALLSTQIENIKIEHAENLIYLTIRKEESPSENKIIKCRKLFLTHGLKLQKIESDLGEMVLDNKIFPRPAVHLLVNDSSPSRIQELIFMRNPLVKYVHDVSSYTREALSLKGKIKVLVLALQHDIVEYPEVYNDILNLCKKNGMIGANARLEGYKWWDICLPTLEDEDLIKITNLHHPMVEWLSTADFSRAFGFYSTRWKTALQ